MESEKLERSGARVIHRQNYNNFLKDIGMDLIFIALVMSHCAHRAVQ